MMKHGLKVICAALQKLNPGQIPVVAADQPLFAILKQIQWQDDLYGDDRCVVMLRGMHSELGFWGILGKLVKESGWEEVLAEADIVSSGRANSVIHASHLKWTRQSHEVSAVAFSKLKAQANIEEETESTFAEWNAEQCQKSLTYFFWDLILRLQMCILTFVRLHRERNCHLYVNILEKLAGLFFALDATNYLRWLPCHTRDSKNLPASVKKICKKIQFDCNRSEP